MLRAHRAIARAHSQNLTLVAELAMSAATVAVISMIVVLALMPG